MTTRSPLHRRKSQKKVQRRAFKIPPHSFKPGLSKIFEMYFLHATKKKIDK